MEQQFGEQEVAFRTLDLYTSAVLEASLNPAPKPEPEWRDIMKKLSEVGPRQQRQCPSQKRNDTIPKAFCLLADALCTAATHIVNWCFDHHNHLSCAVVDGSVVRERAWREWQHATRQSNKHCS